MLSCIKIRAGTAQDEPACVEFDPSACVVVDCDDESLHALKAFYCRNGYPECPQRIPDLQQGFEDVLENLNTTLGPYRDLIELDINRLDDPSELCAYSTEEISTLQERATLDSDGIAQYTDRLQMLRECNRLTTEFLDSPRPSSISETLWENIRTGLSDQIRRVSQQQGAVDTQVEALADSPQKINDLRFVHDFLCANEPQGE